MENRRKVVLETQNKKLYCRVCDLSSYTSIREFAAKVLASTYDIILVFVEAIEKFAEGEICLDRYA